ncbi:MAG: alpha-mannosidase, partial [Clostridia bacterium]|nr:alpha-mannosidase [Clostridia bacterium]
GWQRFQQKGVDNHFLVSYGFGDGGGGSTEWMIENARRMVGPVAGVPAVRQTLPRDFFEQLEKRVSGNKRLPKWSGELYLEYHRGTYTSQGKNKRNNRKLEIALRDVEYWLTRAGIPWPQDELRLIWRDALTLQFHDILPGSSIHKVYEDSDKTYADLFRRVAILKKQAMDALTKGLKGDLVIANTLSHTRDDIVWFDAPEGVTALRDAEGNVFPAQKVGERYVSYVTGIPAMGEKSVWFECGIPAAPGVSLDENGFETPFFTGKFDENKRIVSLFDKAEKRELAKEGKALNTLIYYENRPHNFDAWDINIYYDEHYWEVKEPVKVEVVSVGPVLGALRVEYKTGDSTICQLIKVYKDIKRVDFDTEADWQEPHGLLKAHFPLDIFYNQGQFDIQYGNVTRATHKNTSWDVARFEVCAHKWADVSEAAYGAALMNDCKYGYSVDENSMALTLIKSATEPDPTADIGRHVFSYSLMPHAGDWRWAAVPEKAYEFNIPLEAQMPAKGDRQPDAPFAEIDVPNVMLETVKQALHGEGTIIRMYECYGARTKAKLTLGKAPVEALFTSLMEDDIAPAKFDGCTFEYEFKPYEILTLRIK